MTERICVLCRQSMPVQEIWQRRISSEDLTEGSMAMVLLRGHRDCVEVALRRIMPEVVKA